MLAYDSKIVVRLLPNLRWGTNLLLRAKQTAKRSQPLLVARPTFSWHSRAAKLKWGGARVVVATGLQLPPTTRFVTLVKPTPVYNFILYYTFFAGSFHCRPQCFHENAKVRKWVFAKVDFRIFGRLVIMSRHKYATIPKHADSVLGWHYTESISVCIARA